MNIAATVSTASFVPPARTEGTESGARPTGAAEGTPRSLLRLEGLLAFVAGIVAYAHLGGSWGWFAALFLVPDLSMLGYLAGPRIGAASYNAGHSYVGPALIAFAALVLHAHGALLVASIWVAHIGFDRALGYGLKYASAFGDTHLGALRSRPRSS